MNTSQFVKIGIAILAVSISGRVVIKETKSLHVRIAELEIDPEQLEPYKEAVEQEMKTPVRTEPGVLAIFAVEESS